MSHIPYGYEIRDGTAVIVKSEAETVQRIFRNYINGMGLSSAAKSAGHPLTHSMVKKLLQRKCYLGNEFYPKIIDADLFEQANAELAERAKKTNKKKHPKCFKIHTDFTVHPPTETFDDPVRQAEYLYSLIEVI